jgi:hypothetical protein
MTFSDEVIQTLMGLQTDANFEVAATLRQMTTTKDKYGNRLDTGHTDVPLVGWIELRKTPKVITAEGINPRMRATFVTYDLSTTITLADVLLVGGFTYTITTVENVVISNKVTYRTLDLELSQEDVDDVEGEAPTVGATASALSVDVEGWGD